MSFSRTVLPLLAIVLLSSLVYGRLDEEDPKCNIHYSKNPYQDAYNCKHHGTFKNMCNKIQCFKGMGESCASRDDELGELKHGKCKEPLSCGSCGQCEGCIEIDGGPLCHECPLKPRFRSQDYAITNEFKRNPKFANYDYNHNNEQTLEY